MSGEQKKFYLYVDGRRVSVTEEVYQAHQHYTRKEEYFTYDLKAEGFVCDQEAQTATFTPSREDSYERLLSVDKQFAADGMDTEEQAIMSVWLQDLMRGLSEEERQIIYQVYILDKPEREACAALHLPKTTFHRRHLALLKKLKNFLGERP